MRKKLPFLNLLYLIAVYSLGILCMDTNKSLFLSFSSSSGNFESTELSSRVLSWSKISDNYGCGKGEE